MGHHFSGPNFEFPQRDARLDICDVYAFPTPGDRETSVLIMDVNPLAPAAADAFAPEARYEFVLDTDGDAVADVVYRIQFSQPRDGSQTATVRRAEGADALRGGADGAAIIVDAPVSLGSDAQVTAAGGYRFFAGLRSDPFFADVSGALNGLHFTGSDFFAGADVFSIALEAPNGALGPQPGIGLWCRVLIPSTGAEPAETGASAGWVQVDRGGRPEMVNFYCQGEEKAVYNGSEPARDRARFLDTFAHALEHLGHYAPDDAKTVAATLLPDILPYDYTRPAAYPHNGRTLTDDAFDDALKRISQGQVTSDGVEPHANLLAEFPYLGVPHHAPLSPEARALVQAAQGKVGQPA